MTEFDKAMQRIEAADPAVVKRICEKYAKARLISTTRLRKDWPDDNEWKLAWVIVGWDYHKMPWLWKFEKETV
jgi:hypothetical protein